MLQGIIQTDLKQAQLNKDELRVNTLRLLLSEMKYAEIQKKTTESGSLPEAEIISLVQKEIKKRKEAAAGFRQGDREENARKEELEADILMKYLPEQLSDEELTKIIDGVIAEIEPSGLDNMGKVIGLVLSKTAGKADGGRVSGLLRKKWSTS